MSPPVCFIGAFCLQAEETNTSRNKMWSFAFRTQSCFPKPQGRNMAGSWARHGRASAKPREWTRSVTVQSNSFFSTCGYAFLFTYLPWGRYPNHSSRLLRIFVLLLLGGNHMLYITVEFQFQIWMAQVVSAVHTWSNPLGIFMNMDSEVPPLWIRMTLKGVLWVEQLPQSFSGFFFFFFYYNGHLFSFWRK